MLHAHTHTQPHTRRDAHTQAHFFHLCSYRFYLLFYASTSTSIIVAVVAAVDAHRDIHPPPATHQNTHAIGLSQQRLPDELAIRRRARARANECFECTVRAERMVTCKLLSTARRQSISGPTGYAVVRRKTHHASTYVSMWV